ncbi:hypothetical protein ACU4HD_40790 [Cupriavidus basilensis]
MARIKLSVRYAWWLKPYLRVLAFCCVVAGTQPDQEKLEAKIRRAIRVVVE